MPRLSILPYVVTSKASFIMVSEPIRLKLGMKHLVCSNTFFNQIRTSACTLEVLISVYARQFISEQCVGLHALITALHAY